MNASNLEGLCALVTGSTSGIGLGIARQLVSAGASVALNGFGEAEHIQKLLTELQNVNQKVLILIWIILISSQTCRHAQGGMLGPKNAPIPDLVIPLVHCSNLQLTIIYLAADVGKPEEVRRLVAETERELGKLDILVNNAGIAATVPVEQFPDDDWERILSINLSAPFHAIKTAVPGMKARGFGRIINIASVLGLVALPDKAAYCSSKHGLVGLTKVIGLCKRVSWCSCSTEICLASLTANFSKMFTFCKTCFEATFYIFSPLG